jgi:hypothetical protein
MYSAQAKDPELSGMSRRRTRRLQPTTDQRTPEQRLEALCREPNRERSLRTLARIRHDLDGNPDPGPWIAAARTLSERLIISENAFYYFAELFTECVVLAASDSDPALCRTRDEMEDIERAHGLRDDEYWRPDDAPDDWRALNDAWDRRADEIVVSCLRETANADLADLREQNPREFERRSTQGRIDLWGEDDDVHDAYE